MAQPKRSIETLVQAIREQLAEIQESGESYAIASWPDADGGGGYLLHVDGRMMQIDDYQYGFSHLDQLVSPDLSDEVRGYARAEAGRVASSIEALNADPDMREYASQCAPRHFGLNADLVYTAVESGSLSIEAMFDLGTSVPSGSHIAYPAEFMSTDRAQAAADISVATLQLSSAGTLEWGSRLLAAKGDELVGLVRSDVMSIPVPGGCIQVPAALYEGNTPIASRRPGP